jgi:hypothetical protein
MNIGKSHYWVSGDFNLELIHFLYFVNVYRIEICFIKICNYKMRRACSTNGGEEEACRILVGKPERKRPLRRPRRGWVDNMNMDIREIGWDGVD